MKTQHIAIVPEVAGINASELARVGAALQKQIIRDVAPIWDISATVDAFPHLEDVPVGYWPVIISLGELGGDEGVHCDRKGQPFALVEMSATWSLTASHVCIEMLIDPHGNRTIVGPSPRSDQGSVEFLVDICDPCEDARYAYAVNDVLVSDFCTPEFLAQSQSCKERYSFTGAIEAPYQVLPGGRLGWYDPATHHWWQRNHFGGAARDTDLGFIERRAGRGFGVNHPRAPRHLQATKLTLEAFEARMGIQRQRALRASRSQAHLLRVHLGNPDVVRNLAVDVTAGRLADLGSVLSNRPEVLAALTQSSLAAVNSAGAFSGRRRSLGEALASAEERALAGAAIPAKEKMPSAGQVEATGFEAEQHPAAFRVHTAPPMPAPSPTPARFDEADQRVGAESFHAHPARREVERPVHPSRSAKVRSADPHDIRRATIPPHLPRPAPPPPISRTAGNQKPSSSTGLAPSRVAPSIAPTTKSLRDPAARSSSPRGRLFLASATGVAGVALLAIYWIASARANTPAPAAAGSPAETATPRGRLSAASASPFLTPDSSSRSVVAAGSASASPPSRAAAVARPPKGPRPKITAGGSSKQAAWTNPYDSPPVVEALEQLVEERR